MQISCKNFTLYSNTPYIGLIKIISMSCSKAGKSENSNVRRLASMSTLPAAVIESITKPLHRNTGALPRGYCGNAKEDQQPVPTLQTQEAPDLA